MIKQLAVNNRIRSPELQVLGEEGQQLGVMKIQDALRLAQEQELDLVEVGPNAQPPIAKIMDYGKYIYRKEKQDRKTAVKPKDQEIKTIRIGFKTGVHDLKFKAEKIDELLKEGHIIRAEIFLRGREKALSHMGPGKIEAFLKHITVEYVSQTPIRRSPRGWEMLIKKVK